MVRRPGAHGSAQAAAFGPTFTPRKFTAKLDQSTLAQRRTTAASAERARFGTT